MLFFRKIVILRGVLIGLLIAAVAASAAEPLVTSVAGTPRDGYTLKIKGANFSAKSFAAPLLFWTAEGGVSPSSLGRKSAWDSPAFGGSIVDSSTPGTVLSEGSKKSLVFDYGISENAVLSKVHFDSDRLYVWRKRYDDFDQATDFGIRTRYINLVPLVAGSSLKVGMLMSTADKSLWGKVIRNDVNSSSTGTNFYSNQVGNLTNRTAAAKVPNGTTLYFYDAADIQLGTPLLSAQLNEGSGIFTTFNHKIIRLWGLYSVYANDSYVALEAPNFTSGAFVSENTQIATYWAGSWDNTLYAAKRRWVTEEVQYQNGTVDVADGIFLFWQDRVLGWKNQTFRFTTAALPHKYSDLFQSQVSNGAQPGSKEYFDALYVDDTWHRVVICAESTWAKCTKPEVLIPSAWSDSEISVSYRSGSLINKDLVYVYVINADGIANANGYELGPKRPAFQ